MITLIHGNNVALSRKYYADLKQSAASPVTIEGATATIPQLTQLLEGQELFGNSTQVFIEEFFSKRRASKETDLLAKFIADHANENTIVVWESKELTPKQTGAFGKPELKKFDIPKEVFAFLDSLHPGNAEKAIALFHKTIQTEEPEFVFFMLVRQCRILLALTDESSKEAIDELKRIAPWQKGKLAKQAHAFGQEKLLSIYNELFTVEQGMKTGQLAAPLDMTIDFFLTTL